MVTKEEGPCEGVHARCAARSSNLKIPSLSFTNKKKKKTSIPRSKRPQYEILPSCWLTTRISGCVNVTLSLSSCFSNNSYFEYLATGSKKYSEDCNSQRVRVRTVCPRYLDMVGL